MYITTNLINGKQYVGSHHTDNINDKYLGSGNLIKNSIKKNGKNNFKREILQDCNSILEARKLEGYYIDKYNTLIPNGYNISPNGGNFINMDNLTDEEIKKINNTLYFGNGNPPLTSSLHKVPCLQLSAAFDKISELSEIVNKIGREW